MGVTMADAGCSITLPHAPSRRGRGDLLIGLLTQDTGKGPTYPEITYKQVRLRAIGPVADSGSSGARPRAPARPYRFSAASMSATRVNLTRGRSTARPLATSSLSSRTQSSQEKQFG